MIFDFNRLCLVGVEKRRRMVGGSLAGLQEHLKLARDYALEGLYDTSIIVFDGDAVFAGDLS